MQESEWFEKKGPVKRLIYIPKHIAKNLKLNKNDKITVKIKNNNKVVIFPVRVQTAETRSGISYRFGVPKDFQRCLGSPIVSMKIIKLEYCIYKANTRSRKLNLSTLIDHFQNFSRELPPFSVTEWIRQNQIVMWHEAKGKRPYNPIIITEEIAITNELAKYAGLYFAEGNKQQYFRMYATTKELAKLSIRCYNQIIKNPNLIPYIKFDKSIRDKRTDEEIKQILYNYWKDAVFPYRILDIKIKTRRYNSSKDSEKRLRFGTLVLRDGRILPRLLHNWIIEEVMNIGKTDKEILKKFFEGLVLGDGNIVIRGGRKRQAFGYLEIGTNPKEIETITELCENLKLKYEKLFRKGNDIRIRIRGYCDLVFLLYDKFLEDYPKQRNKLIYGLKNRVETYILQALLNNPQHTVPFKMEFRRRASSYLVVNQGELIANDLISFNGESVRLTQKGLEFIDYLKELKII